MLANTIIQSSTISWNALLLGGGGEGAPKCVHICLPIRSQQGRIDKGALPTQALLFPWAVESEDYSRPAREVSVVILKSAFRRGARTHGTARHPNGRLRYERVWPTTSDWHGRLHGQLVWHTLG